jgi:hypothetical protein
MRDNEINWGIVDVKIPVEAFFNPYLSNNEKVLFGWLLALDLYSGGTYVTDAYISQHLNCSLATAKKAILNLAKYKYLNVGYKKGRGKRTIRTVQINLSYHSIYRKLSGEAHSYMFSREYQEKDSGLREFLCKITDEIVNNNFPEWKYGE